MATNSRAALHPALRGIASAAREARNTAQRDLNERMRATTILRPEDVSGDYDAGRLLVTTRGGDFRQITVEDLRAFQDNIRRLKGKFKGGITPQSVIDLATQGDRDRANKQMHFAVPKSIQGGKIHFVTNSGPDSKVQRHNVHVVLLDFDATVAASPNDPKKLGKLAAQGRLLFDCDCERHRFFFRYIATIGKFNTGRNETGYPKIRNPELAGVACKHVLRTMHALLKNANVQLRIANSILSARNVLDRRAIKAQHISAEEVRAMASEQQGRRKSSRNLSTTDDKKAAAALRKAKESMKQTASSAAKKKSDAEKRKILRSAQNLLQLGAITQEHFNQITGAS